MIFLTLLAAVIKVFLPDTNVFHVLAAIILTTWIILNYTNIDCMVANNLVARYNTIITAETRQFMTCQELENCIADIFSDQYWSPDYYPALNQLEEPWDHKIALNILKTRSQRRKGGQHHMNLKLYDWTLCCLLEPTDSQDSKPEP